MDRDALFKHLGVMVRESASSYDALLQAQVREHGHAALAPEWLAYNLYGRHRVDIDAYFPKDRLVPVALQTLRDCGVSLGGADLTLDVFAREGKSPGGYTELVTPRTRQACADIRVSTSAWDEASIAAQRELLHELGHAAHFANIDGTSVMHYFRLPGVVAESFATVFEQLTSSEAWLRRHGRTLEGQPMPIALARAYATASRAMRPFHLRNTLAVAFVEDALLRLPDRELTPANILATAAQADRAATHLEAPTHPVLNVAHLYDSEASAYFHTYAVATDFAASLLDALGASALNHHGQGLGSRFLSLWQQGSRTSLADLHSLLQRERNAQEPILEGSAPTSLDARIALIHSREILECGALEGPTSP